MDSKICKICKWWNAPQKFSSPNNTYGNVWVEALGTCICPDIRHHYPNPRLGEDTPAPPDAASIAGWINFNTGPEFGCTNWERIDSEWEDVDKKEILKK